MQGIYTPVTKIRRQVFSKLAKMAYEDQPITMLDEIPFEIIEGEVAKYRDSVFVERAIVTERLRRGFGLPKSEQLDHTPLSVSAKPAISEKKILDAPLVDVISFACDACPETSVFVTDNCRGCLAHPCSQVCPVGAVKFVNSKSVIDKDLCIKCGRCISACPYTAIVKYDRPCSSSCGVNAIESDHLGRAKINQDKCVACGQCLVNCPFGAIADRSEIVQVIQAMKMSPKVVATVAPAFVGQFGPMATWEKLKGALTDLGFADVVEVAHGADVVAKLEAEHFVNHVGKDLPYLGTSCCPAWKLMVEKNFPEQSHCVSGKLTPMIVTAQKIKEIDPNAIVVFIGPCSAKKLEACREDVLNVVDFVLTFEELMGMFVAKEIDFTVYEDNTTSIPATPLGRGFAVADGVTHAITENIKLIAPDLEYNTAAAAGLFDCKKLMTLAKLGKRDGYLLEGMACPGGCVAGAGTIIPISKGTSEVNKFANSSTRK